MGHEMSLEHLQPLPVLKADDVIGLHRRADRHLRLGLGLRRGGPPRNAVQRGVDVLNQGRQVIDGNTVVADVSGDDVGGKSQQSIFGTLIFKHRYCPRIEQWRVAVERLDVFSGLAPAYSPRNSWR